MKEGMLLYIDPGTGSMLFTILIGVIGTGAFFFRKLIMKIKFRLAGGKAEAVSKDVMPIVIFSETKGYWRLFKPICDEFEKRETELIYWTATPDDPALKEDYKYVKCEFIGEGNKAFAKLNMMHAKICLSSTPGLDVYQWKRSRDVNYYVHILHEPGGALFYRMFGIDFYDAVLLTGDFQIKEIRDLEKVRSIKEKELKVVGMPSLDVMKKRKDETEISAHDRRTVLLAPTWGVNGILSIYGGKIIDALMKTGYRIVVRPHPQSMISEKEMMEKIMKEYPESEDISWNFDPDNFDVLSTADVMISDYSGVVFDYALVFDRPIIYTGYEVNKDPYDAYWLEGKTWRDDIMAELGVPLKPESIDNIKDVIDEVIESDTYAKGRERARRECWANIGESAGVITDYLLEKVKEF